MDDDSESSDAAPSLTPSYQIVGESDFLHGYSQHEISGMDDEAFSVFQYYRFDMFGINSNFGVYAGISGLSIYFKGTS